MNQESVDSSIPSAQSLAANATAKQVKKPATRWKAAVIHLSISALVGLCVFCLMHFIWYPDYFFSISRGLELFLLILVIDVCIGPLITLFVYTPYKPGSLRKMLTPWNSQWNAEQEKLQQADPHYVAPKNLLDRPLNMMALDLAIIALFQLIALGYGMHAIFIGRPTFVVYQGYSGFAVTTPRLVPEKYLEGKFLEITPEKYRHFPIWGPKFVGYVRPTDPEILEETTLSMMYNCEYECLPFTFDDYTKHKSEVYKNGAPFVDLYTEAPDYKTEIEAWLKTHPGMDNGRWLPMRGPSKTIPVFVNEDGDIIGAITNIELPSLFKEFTK